MGSATTYQLAKAGVKVLGIDRYSPPHVLGSSHGDTRVTRQAIGEGTEYVPLVMRSHEIWKEIEELTGHELLEQCGALMMAAQNRNAPTESSNFFDQTVASAKQYGIGHQLLSTEDIRSQYPQFDLSSSEVGYFEPGAGYVRPEKCVEAQIDLAGKHGADVNLDEHVRSYVDDGQSVTVETTRGTYTADKIIVTAGPWVNELVPELAPNFKLYRQVMYWFDLKDKSRFDLYRTMPVYLWKFGLGPNEAMYGFPMIDGPDGGAKIATGNYTVETTLDEVQRGVSQDEIDAMYERYVKDRLPGLSNKCVKAASCIYTVTSGHRFVIDFHPAYKNVIIASPCSGHGFKHSAAIGEALSQMATTGKSLVDLSSFKINR